MKDGLIMDFGEQTRDIVAADLLIDKITYHKNCYANTANIAKLEREKSGFVNPLKVAKSLS